MNNPKGSDDGQESLITKNALEASLTPPRVPPMYTAHRAVLLGRNPSSDPLAVISTKEAHSQRPHGTLSQRIRQRLEQTPLSTLPHPHLSSGPELSDQITRFLGVLLPLETQNHIRDSGTFRSISDTLLTISAPLVALTSPTAIVTFARLSRKVQTLSYGPHPRQIVDLFLPKKNKNTPSCSRFIFFLHGGAWGSGAPWMYRLVAQPFLEQCYAVAIVGYRTYPDGNASDQVEDCQRAASYIATQFPQWQHAPVTVMGHSSGAHIGLLMVVQQAQRDMMGQESQEPRLNVDSFLGISGPYDISHHFDYEAGRGVEELSPMKPVCGYTRDQFRLYSPALQLQQTMADVCETSTPFDQSFMPSIILIHGIEDKTVPFTATAEAARILRSCGVTKCHEVYLAATQHQDPVMELMLGGRTRRVILQVIQELSNHSSPPVSSVLLATSKL